MSKSEKSKFEKHLEWASKIVATWPDWKQKLLGGVGGVPVDIQDMKTFIHVRVGNDNFPAKQEDIDNMREQIEALQKELGKKVPALVTNHAVAIQLVPMG